MYPFMWSCQCWLVVKNFSLSTLCEHRMLLGRTASGNGWGKNVREIRASRPPWWWMVIKWVFGRLTVLEYWIFYLIFIFLNCSIWSKNPSRYCHPGPVYSKPNRQDCIFNIFLLPIIVLRFIVQQYTSTFTSRKISSISTLILRISE